MLESLHIRNLALVASLDLEFTGGLNVITGETGAGKSLIIGAIQLLAGGRATPASIRKGETSCEASGVFCLNNDYAELRQAIDKKLADAAIPPSEDNRILIRRVITDKNGSRAFVNAAPVTVAFLRELGELLIDIHGPHDNQSLLLNSHQLALLDTFAGDHDLQLACRQHHEHLTDLRHQLDELANDGLMPEEADLLKHQLKEIGDAALQPGEDEELFRKYKLADNGKRLIELSQAVSQQLDNAENSISEQLSGTLRVLRELESLDPEGGETFTSQLLEIIDLTQTLSQSLDEYAQNTELDPEAFQILEERLELVQKLKRKYGPALNDVFDTQNRIQERLQKILGRGDLINSLRKELSVTETHLQLICDNLHEVRQKAAEPLAQAITEKLRHLGFAKAAFAIQVTPDEPGPNGASAVEFMFAPNVGEDLQPLKNTASSGETARVMLAIKTVLSEADAIPVLVFDEIDANVGGRVAATVADELRAVARHHQVFSITHLPQIAAAGQNHYLVEKNTVNDRTITAMHALSSEERTAEIIRMLGADCNSDAAASHARELIKKAQKTQP